MEFILTSLEKEDIPTYKKDMQEAFQRDAMQEFNDLDVSLTKKGAVAYKAIVDGTMSGGAIVVIDESTQHNHLDFYT